MVVIKKHISTNEQNLNANHSFVSNTHGTSIENVNKQVHSENIDIKANEVQPEKLSYAIEDEKWGKKLVQRGKDVLSTQTSSVATAAAVIVGAALIEVELIPGLVIGAGAILLGKLFPEITDYVRPVIKGALRAGYSATHKVRQIISEANEQVNDLVAEVKQEQTEIESKDHLQMTPESKLSDIATH